MRYFTATFFGLFLFVGPAQAQDFCADLCPTSCTLTATDALAVLNAAVGLDPGMCGSSTTTTLPGTTSTTTTSSTTTTTSSTTTTTTMTDGTVVERDGSNATAIRNLEVDGVLYDVEFDFDFGADLFGAPPFTFNLEIQAINANEEVNLALNSVPEVVTVGPQMSDNYIVPFDIENLNYIVRSSEYPLIGQWLQVPQSDMVPRLEPRTWAVFTEVTP